MVWIKVENGLPPKEQELLISSLGNNIDMAFYEFDGYPYKWWGRLGPYGEEEVKYWMPIPPLPVVQENRVTPDSSYS